MFNKFYLNFLYKTQIRLVTPYALKTTTINKKEEDLKTMERKIIKTILGPKVTNNGEKERKNRK